MSVMHEPSGGSDQIVKISVRAYSRGMLALHISCLDVFRQVIGPNLWPDLQGDLKAALDQLERTPWGQFLHGRLCEMVGQIPELVAILEQPDGLERALDVFCQAAESALQEQGSDSELEAVQKHLVSATGQLKTELAEIQSDGEPPLGEEVETDIETIANEPWRLAKAIPTETLGLGARERRKLEAVLQVSLSDDEQYSQTVLPTLLGFAVRPEAVERPPLTASSPVWKWTGTSPSTKMSPELKGQSIGLAIDAVTNLIRRMDTLEGRREMVGSVLGQQLRREHGLGKGRRHEEVSLEVDGEIEAGIEGYPEVEAHLDLEALLLEAPPRQRQALNIYLESKRAGRTVEDLAREQGLNPVNVRNNFKAFADKHRR